MKFLCFTAQRDPRCTQVSFDSACRPDDGRVFSENFRAHNYPYPYEYIIDEDGVDCYEMPMYCELDSEHVKFGRLFATEDECLEACMPESLKKK